MAQAIEGVEFVATCARHLESAQRKGQEYGVTAHFDDYERMMDAIELDAVFVTTPHSVHAEVVLAAFRHGLHVLNEKPMATSLDDCRAMVQEAEKAGVIFMALPYDYSASIVTGQSLLKEELLGKITGAEACLNIPGPPRDNWYYDKSIAHGGATLDTLVYPTSRLCSLIGGATRVTGFLGNLIPQRIVGGGKRIHSDVDDNVTLLVEYEHGQQAVLRSLWGTAYGENSTTVYGREGTVILPSDGRVLLQRRDGQCSIPGAKPVEWRGWSGCFEIPRLSVNENMTEHFVRAIREEKQPTCTGARQLHVHEIIFKGGDSAREGRTLSLETPYDPWHALDPALFETRAEFI
jgi:predicted dehydrogenase